MDHFFIIFMGQIFNYFERLSFQVASIFQVVFTFARYLTSVIVACKYEMRKYQHSITIAKNMSHII